MVAFLSIKSLDDLATFLGYPSYKRLQGLLYPNLKYTAFTVKKRTGGERTIHAPGLRLKELQRKIAFEVKQAFGKRSPVAHSFIDGRSIVTNALPHVGKASVVRVDLTDFFGHINFGRVKGVFANAPFDFADDIATVLAHICCFENKLPQGAPTSAALTNFICLALDREVAKLAKRYKGRFTRYADDLTFSFKHLSLEKIPKDIFEVNKNSDGSFSVTVGKLLVSVIEAEGFKVNEKKTTGANRDKRQLVTGLVVNKQLTVPRKYIDGIRRALHLWRKHGLEEASARCIDYLHVRQYASTETPQFIPLLMGKLTFLSMVVGRSSPSYQKFALEFNALAARDVPTDPAVRLKIDPKVQTVQDAIRATWYTLNDECIEGTAFRFEGNIWVTCAHCVGDIRTRTVYPGNVISSGDWRVRDLRVRVVSVDWDRDLATLRPIPLQSVPRHLPYFAEAKYLPAQEQRVGTIGFPAARINQPPIFMRARILRSRTKKTVSRIEIDKQILKGNSGGPLFDEQYLVLGVVAEGAAVAVNEENIWDHGENACIAIGELHNLTPK